ncbi:MAG: hypothetical protein ABGY41_16885, partial [Candidatus Poribacteria bacterium]
MDADGRRARAVAGTRWGGTAPTWSPDGREIAYTAAAGMVIAPLNGGPERTLLKTPESEGSPAWSPDGRRIAFSRSGNGPSDIWVVDTDGQNAT